MKELHHSLIGLLHNQWNTTADTDTRDVRSSSLLTVFFLPSHTFIHPIQYLCTCICSGVLDDALNGLIYTPPPPDQRANEGTILWTFWRDWPTTTCPVSDVSSTFCVGHCLIQTGKEEAAPGSASMTPVKVMARCRVSATEGMNTATTASNYWRTSGQVVSWACTVKWMTRRDDLEFL